MTTNNIYTQLETPTYENWNLEHMGETYNVEHRLNRGTLGQLVYGMKVQCGGRTSKNESENTLFGVMDMIVNELVSRFNTIIDSFSTQEQRQFFGPLIFGRRDDGNIGSRINRAIPRDVIYSNSSFRRFTKALNGIINRLLRPSVKYINMLSPEQAEWHTAFRTHLTELSDYINVQIPLIWRPAVQANRETNPKVRATQLTQQHHKRPYNREQRDEQRKRPYNREQRHEQREGQREGQHEGQREGQRFNGRERRPRVFVKRQEPEDDNGFQQVPRRYGGQKRSGGNQRRAPEQNA